MNDAIDPSDPAEAHDDVRGDRRIVFVIQGAGSGHVGSLDSVCAMIETIKALLRHGDVAGTGLEEAVQIVSVVVYPDARIVIHVPSAMRPVLGDLFTSMGRCVAVGNGDQDVKLRNHEAEMAGTLAAIIGASGWGQLRLSIVEDDWDAVVLSIPTSLRSPLARLMPRPTLRKAAASSFGH